MLPLMFYKPIRKCGRSLDAHQMRVAYSFPYAAPLVSSLPQQRGKGHRSAVFYFKQGRTNAFGRTRCAALPPH